MKKIAAYEVICELGRGGMGIVYKAHDPQLGREVAIKMLAEDLSKDADQVTRFKREAQSIAALNHQNIVQIYAIGEHRGQAFFAMEYVEGVPLDRLLQDQGRLQPVRAVEILREAALGLAFAHDRGILHRDVKPGNLLLDQHGIVKIVDFGIARVADGSEKLTATGQFLGTPGYLSPEVCQGGEVDQRTDLFSLGIVLYEMLVGDVPFHAESPLALLQKVVSAEIPDIRAINQSVDLQLQTILSKMLARDPKDRYCNGGLLVTDLNRYLKAMEPSGDHLPSRVVRPSRKSTPPKRSLVAGGLVLTLLIFMLVLGWQLASKSAQEQAPESLIAEKNPTWENPPVAEVAIESSAMGSVGVLNTNPPAQRDTFPVGSKSAGQTEGAGSPEPIPAGAEVLPLTLPSTAARPEGAIVAEPEGALPLSAPEGTPQPQDELLIDQLRTDDGHDEILADTMVAESVGAGDLGAPQPKKINLPSSSNDRGLAQPAVDFLLSENQGLALVSEHDFLTSPLEYLLSEVFGDRIAHETMGSSGLDETQVVAAMAQEMRLRDEGFLVFAQINRLGEDQISPHGMTATVYCDFVKLRLYVPSVNMTLLPSRSILLEFTKLDAEESLRRAISQPLMELKNAFKDPPVVPVKGSIAVISRGHSLLAVPLESHLEHALSQAGHPILEEAFYPSLVDLPKETSITGDLKRFGREGVTWVIEIEVKKIGEETYRKYGQSATRYRSSVTAILHATKPNLGSARWHKTIDYSLHEGTGPASAAVTEMMKKFHGNLLL